MRLPKGGNLIKKTVAKKKYKEKYCNKCKKKYSNNTIKGHNATKHSQQDA